MPDERFTAACAFEMPFGKYQGVTLSRIGSNSEGLLYLDWLVGQDWVNDPLKDTLETFLRHPAIARQLNVAMGEE